MSQIKFDRTLPYNNLPFLPPIEVIENDISILKKLVTASRALATIDGSLKKLPNPYMLVNTLALQEAKTSVEIENIFTTEDELYKAISKTNEKKDPNPATKEVLRYREALWAGYNTLKNKELMDLELIVAIFQQVKNSNAGIRPPQSKISIKRGESEFRSGEIIYTPPHGDKVLNDLILNLMDYLNDDEKYPTDPLLKMCVAHYQFEAIHPFSNGNGRTGRILNLLYLTQKKLISHPVLYLSKYIIQHKDNYYHLLGNVTKRATWGEWVLYMLDAVEKTAVLTNVLINEILEQMESTLIYAKKQIKWYNKEVNELIFSQPYIRPSVIGDLLGVKSRTTLTNYFNELTTARILTFNKDGKEVFYINEDLLRILSPR